MTIFLVQTMFFMTKFKAINTLTIYLKVCENTNQVVKGEKNVKVTSGLVIWEVLSCLAETGLFHRIALL